MGTYTKILIASDLGKHTYELIKKAKSLTSEPEQITLFHVVEPYDANPYGLIPQSPILPIVDVEAVETDIFKRKNHIIKAIANAYSLNERQCIIEKGKPKKQILNFAKSNEYDLIIAASRDPNEIKPYLGSTAKALVKHAHCDVLIVDIFKNN